MSVLFSNPGAPPAPPPPPAPPTLATPSIVEAGAQSSNRQAAAGGMGFNGTDVTGGGGVKQENATATKTLLG